jgi:hypothetical protein
MPHPALSTRNILAAVTAFVAVVAVVALIVWATAGGGGHGTAATTAATTGATASSSSGHPATLTHRQFALLYLHAILHKTRISVLSQWPRPPYQHYTSGTQTCYEWWDKPIALYNLCFRNGVLTLKAIE